MIGDIFHIISKGKYIIISVNFQPCYVTVAKIDILVYN